MMLAIHKEKPDRLPVTVHQWQDYHLEEYLGGISALGAFQKFGMDAAIQYFDSTKFSTPEWNDETQVISRDPDNRIVHHTITTPAGTLTYKTEGDRKTTWITEYMIKKDEDICLIEKYMPVPKLDQGSLAQVYEDVGDKGIVRGFVWGDQAGCWQHATCLMDAQDLILATYDKPDWVHELLQILLIKKLQFIESMKEAKFDLIETGGGAGSSTLISPTIHEKFCLPYDRQMHDALHELGFNITYHTCGGTLGIEEHIVANGADASETLASPSIGGNQEPWDFKKIIGNRLALIGGMDQYNDLTVGIQRLIRKKVHRLFEEVGYEGGYICSCADHFFETPIENIQSMADAARECVY
jgi:uroporphyrinogen-III decarboxylase